MGDTEALLEHAVDLIEQPIAVAGLKISNLDVAAHGIDMRAETPDMQVMHILDLRKAVHGP